MTEIFRGKRLMVESRKITLPSGRTTERVVVHPGGAVAILPVEGEWCWLERQYRYAIGKWICEAPAGTMDEGETPEETAYRELIEECGLSAEELIPRGYIYPAPGYTDEVIHLFEARGLAPSTIYEKDEDEQIMVEKVRIDDLRGMIDSGEISDAKTICIISRCLEVIR